MFDVRTIKMTTSVSDPFSGPSSDRDQDSVSDFEFQVQRESDFSGQENQAKHEILAKRVQLDSSIKGSFDSLLRYDFPYKKFGGFGYRNSGT